MHTKEDFYKVVQGILKTPPVIIWGSGATIPYDLPSMWTLNESIKDKFDFYDSSALNLEEELGKSKYEPYLDDIKDLIWDEVAVKDRLVLEEISKGQFEKYQGLKELAAKFIAPHPGLLNIITTNYDRLLEYAFSYSGIDYTDGFNGRIFSKFDTKNFKEKGMVNLFKVHGSLNWFQIKDEAKFQSERIVESKPLIICPGKSKFEQALTVPYRDILIKSDEAINKASAFLAIGFGFNDKHLTPKVISKVKDGAPIVVVTKEVTDTCKEELNSAREYVLIEDAGNNQTRVTYKKNHPESYESILEVEGDYWSLNEFLNII